MKHIGILRPDSLVNILNTISIPAAALYVFSMLVYPWFAAAGDWHEVQYVWDRWQSLNVGMLALVSSITAFNISRFNAEKQRERDFLASKAFLPDALSGLTSYLKSSASIFIAGWNAIRGDPLEIIAPEPPARYKEVFRECIRHADPDVGEYLSTLLVRLQIHTARLSSYLARQAAETWSNPDKSNLLVYLYRVGELQAMVNRLFPFSRSMAEFDGSALTWEDLRNAYGNLDIWTENFRIAGSDNLEAFTKRQLEKTENQDTE